MARALRAWRGTRTLAEVAAAARVNVDTLSDLEGEKIGRPRNKTLRALESAYGREEGELDRIAWEAEHPPPEGASRATRKASALDEALGSEDADLARKALSDVYGDAAPEILARIDEKLRRRSAG